MVHHNPAIFQALRNNNLQQQQQPQQSLAANTLSSLPQLQQALLLNQQQQQREQLQQQVVQQQRQVQSQASAFVPSGTNGDSSRSQCNIINQNTSERRVSDFCLL